MSSAVHPVSLAQPLRAVRFAMSSAAEAEAGRQLQDAERTAAEQGRQEGEKLMSEQLLKQRAEMLQLQQGVLESLRNAVSQVVRDSEQALAALALEVARKLVSGMPVSAEMVEAAIREALAQVEENTDCEIHLNPEDCALLEAFNPKFLQGESSSPRTRIHRAPDVSRGGCLVKTRLGIIDARRETKLALLEKSLLA